MADDDWGDEFELRTVEHKGRVYVCRYKNGKPEPGRTFKTRDGRECPPDVLAKYGYAAPKADGGGAK